MGKKGPDWRDQAGFWRRLRHLLGAGVPLSESVELAGGECRGQDLVDAFSRVRERVASGGRLWGALKEHPEFFPPIVTWMARSGEDSGRLDEVCAGIAELLEGGLVTGKATVTPGAAASGGETLDELLAGLVDEERDEEVDSPVASKVAEILHRAVEKRATDVHLVPTRKGLRVRFRVDGEARDEDMLEPSWNRSVLARMKIIANLDIAERRRPQDGRMCLKHDGRDVRFRVSTLPCAHGEICVLRADEPWMGALALEDMRLREGALASLRAAAAEPCGLVVVSGPTGSGKSTTLNAVLKAARSDDVVAYSLEDPIAFDLPGVRQIEVNRDAGLTPPAALRVILRQDPDIIASDFWDAETFGVLLEAAVTGHLILTAPHAANIEHVLQRITGLGAEPVLLAGTLAFISSQRLVRKLCEHCKAQVFPPREALLGAGLTEKEAAGAEILGPVGCAKCKGGYGGRIMLIEAMPVSGRISEMLATGAPAAEIRRAAVEDGMLTLRRYGLAEVLDGRTSLEQVLSHTPPDA